MTPVTDPALVSAGTYKKTFADKAAFVTALADYDVVIDETYIASPANANADKAAVLAALDVTESDFKTGAILLRVDRHLSDVESTTDHATHTMDWYESALPRPALVLMDLAHMVWPDAFPAPAAGCARYFRGIFSDTITKPIVNGKAQCDDWSAAESEARCLTNAVLDTDPYLSVAPHRPAQASRRRRRRRHRRRDAPRVSRSSSRTPPERRFDRSIDRFPLFLFSSRSRGGCARPASRRDGDEKANPPTIRTRPSIDPTPIDRAARSM